MIDESELLQVIQGMNPWWRNPSFTSFPRKRAAYGQVERIFFKTDLKRACVLSGPRRVGKTVILHQLAEEMLKQGRDPQEILYLSLDHTILKQERFDRLLEIYRQNIHPGGGPAALLLDEIQFLDDWPTWLKMTVDFSPEYRITATGSAAIEIASGYEESAAGRLRLLRAPTLSFYEYLLLGDKPTPEFAADAGMEALAEMDKRERNRLMLDTLSVQEHFHDYLLMGGFPRPGGETDLPEIQLAIRDDVVNRVLKHDMSALFGVRRLPEVEKLFAYFCVNSGGLMDQKGLAKELGINVRTLSDYIDYLISSGLIYLLPGVKTTGKSALKNRSKVYIADASIRNAVLMKGRSLLTDAVELGLLVETAVHNHLVSASKNSFTQFGYWRDRNGREVDLVQLLPDGKTLPIEVKYKTETRAADLKNLKEYMKVSGANLGVLVVRRAEEFDVLTEAETRILKIPAYLLLYLLGGVEFPRSAKN